MYIMMAENRYHAEPSITAVLPVLFTGYFWLWYSSDHKYFNASSFV